MIKRHKLSRGNQAQLAKITAKFNEAVKDAMDLHRSVMDETWKPKWHARVYKTPEN